MNPQQSIVAGLYALPVAPYLTRFSIHEELEELAKAGLPYIRVLKASTIFPAKFLKRQNNIGTIDAGEIADLVMLNGNPLKDIASTKKIG